MAKCNECGMTSPRRIDDAHYMGACEAYQEMFPEASGKKPVTSAPVGGSRDPREIEAVANHVAGMSNLEYSEAGDQSDNASAAQALSQTIQAPPDRARDSNRAGVKCLGCGSGAQGFDQHGPICVNCDEDYQQYGQ